MRLWLVFLGFTVGLAARAEVWSSGTGLSLGSSGVQVVNPKTGNLPELTYDNGAFTLGFSVLGSNQPASSGAVRVLPPYQAPSSNVLTNSDEFFSGVGKQEPSNSRRPLAR